MRATIIGKKGAAVAFAHLASSDRHAIALFGDSDLEQQRAFFAARPDLKATPLRRLRGLARTLGLGDVRAKDETRRFGLNAFKAAGAIFAITTLRERGRLAAGETLVCASEGNHGRAVARAAREAGCHARVYLADSVKPARVAAIEGEGALAVLVPGTYDDAVRRMTADARAQGWRVISDTALPGDDHEVPRLIMLGYTRLMDEAEEAWQPGPPPDAIYVPGGVGGLLGAVASWTAWRFPADRPAIVCVEPTSAACLQMSAREGRPTTLSGPFDTVMAGLRCGEVSHAAFDAVQSIVDAYIAIDDQAAFNAIRRLASPVGGDPVIQAGASGAAALGGLLTTLHDPVGAPLKKRLQLGPGSRVLVLISEGVTDPDVFAQASGSPKIGHQGPPGGELV